MLRQLLPTTCRCEPHLLPIAARGEDTATSDVDLLVDLDAEQGLVALAAISRELTTLIGVSVDVIPASSLKAAIRDEVLAEAVPL